MATQTQIEQWIKIKTPCLDQSADSVLTAVASDPKCIHLKDKYGNSPLLKLMRQGIAHSENIHFALENGADIDATDEEGKSAIWFTAGHLKWLESLLLNNANPNLKDKDGETLLMKMAKNGEVDSVQLLLDYGADPTLTDKLGRTARDITDDILVHKYSSTNRSAICEDRLLFPNKEVKSFDNAKNKYERIGEILMKAYQIRCPGPDEGNSGEDFLYQPEQQKIIAAPLRRETQNFMKHRFKARQKV